MPLCWLMQGHVIKNHSIQHPQLLCSLYLVNILQLCRYRIPLYKKLSVYMVIYHTNSVGMYYGTHHGTYVPTEFVWYMTMYTDNFLYKGILYLHSCKMLTKYRLHSSVGVEYYDFLFLVIRRVPNHSLRTACFDLFKLSTCSSLLIGRGHSTWFGVQILTQIPTQLHLYFYSFDVIKHHVVL